MLRLGDLFRDLLALFIRGSRRRQVIVIDRLPPNLLR